MLSNIFHVRVYEGEMVQKYHTLFLARYMRNKVGKRAEK